MYNIAKVAKGEILLFFNEIFDSLCKVRFAGSIYDTSIKSLLACRRYGTLGKERRRIA